MSAEKRQKGSAAPRAANRLFILTACCLWRIKEARNPVVTVRPDSAHPTAPWKREDEPAGGSTEMPSKKDQNRTSVRLGNEYRIAHSTIESSGRFSRTLDEGERKAPGLRRDVLSGAIRISKTRINQMAEMPKDEVQAISERLRSHMRQAERVSLQDSAQIINGLATRQESTDDKLVIVTGIKQMPEYDPDAEINGLLLTAPTWITTIQRLTDRTDFRQVSEGAREKLFDILRKLESATSRLQHKAGR